MPEYKESKSQFVVFTPREEHFTELGNIASDPASVFDLIMLDVRTKRLSFSSKYNEAQEVFYVSLRDNNASSVNSNVVLSTSHSDYYKACCQLVLAVSLTEDGKWLDLRKQQVVSW